MDRGNLLIPPQLADRPRIKNDLPLPWYAARTGDRWDLRVRRPYAFEEATSKGLCWICGEARKREATFILSPRLFIQRCAFDPPMHAACAQFAVGGGCPFLSDPRHQRQGFGLLDPADQTRWRNPGLAITWATEPEHWTVHLKGDDTRLHPAGWYDLKSPRFLAFWWAGRRATQLEARNALTRAARLLAADWPSGHDEQLKLERRVEAAHARLTSAYEHGELKLEPA